MSGFECQDIDPAVVPHCLRTEDDSGLVACGFAAPRLSWRLSSERAAVLQRAYQLQVASDASFATDVTKLPIVETRRPFLAQWPAEPLKSRERRWWRVRILTDRGWTAWSDGSEVEGSLFDPADWIARPITPVSNRGRGKRGPVPLLRREFDSPQSLRAARLYVTALGIHDIRINDQPVGPDLLEPGWTAYPQRLLFASYDVTSLLVPGPNVISSAIGDGWWRGELTWMGRRAIYGDTTALLAQLEIELESGSRLIVATDRSWKGSTGGLRLAELYDGSDFDLRLEPQGWRSSGFDDSAWEEVDVLELPGGLEQRTMPGVQALAEFEPASIARRGTVIRIDTGQNLAGFLKIGASGRAGGRISVRHAEVLDHDGQLHTEPLRNARAADNYVVDGSPSCELQPRFTFHGFRFAELEFSPDVDIHSIKVVTVGSAISYTGEFECSDEDVNRLFLNSVWSQRGNFLAIPTDCPQRDERLGWTGDIQVYAEAACLNADCRTFLASWLRDLSYEQRQDGAVPSTVPNVIHGHEFEYGGVGWGDAATLVPWAIFQSYGDIGVLERQFESMRRWVDYGASRRDDQGCWTGDFHLGDWLDPGAPADQPHRATTPGDFIATCYLAESARCLARASELLGRRSDWKAYKRLADQTGAAAWRRWGSIASETQTGCAISIMFEIAPKALHGELGRKLAALVQASGGRIATGFLGTPLVLPALSRTGQIDAAYALLLNRNCPGWLFQVDRGATTMWERWDAVREDGSLHEGEMQSDEGATMTSFNHYAYGAVSTWLYHTVAGLAPAASEPGFGHVIFAPQPGGGISSAGASLVSPYGRTSIHWSADADSMNLAITLPPGATGELHVPCGYRAADGADAVQLLSGVHQLALTSEATAPKNPFQMAGDA